MRFAVYNRQVEQKYAEENQVPKQLRLRTLVMRAFDADAMMVGWQLGDGRELESAIGGLLADPRAAYLHIHYAAPDCYAARTIRAGT
jgi:hypothetical protein